MIKENNKNNKNNEEKQRDNPYFTSGKFNESQFVADFLKEFPLVSCGNAFFTANGRVNESDLKKVMYERIKRVCPIGAAKRVPSAMEALRLEAYVAEMPALEDRINLENGTYFYLNSEFSPQKDFCRNRLPVRYNPEASLPMHWLAFLSDLLEAEDILTLQEFMGYCLIPSNRAQAMLLIKGNGGEGKSRIGLVMKKLLGDNMKNGSIAKVESNAFARADLENQLLAVDDDMQMEALKSTHYLKTLITAEMPMDLERKGEQSYQGEIYCRFMAFSNGDLNALYDRSDGFYRRQIILNAKKKPKDRWDDPFLADKLRSEAEGILLWCIEGLQRLVDNAFRFTESESARRNRSAAKNQANNIYEFLKSEGYIRLRADDCASSAELYQVYSTWCADNAYKPLSARSFSSTLIKCADDYKLDYTNNIPVGNKRVRGFWGIGTILNPRIY